MYWNHKNSSGLKMQRNKKQKENFKKKIEVYKKIKFFYKLKKLVHHTTDLSEDSDAN